MSVDQTTPGIQRIDGANWYDQPDEFNITWDTEAWSDMIDHCDIYLMIYLEETDYVQILFLSVIAERVDYDEGEFVFKRSSLYTVPAFRTGIFKLVPHGEGSDR